VALAPRGKNIGFGVWGRVFQRTTALSGIKYWDMLPICEDHGHNVLIWTKCRFKMSRCVTGVTGQVKLSETHFML
jgi:hypothetical protein